MPSRNSLISYDSLRSIMTHLDPFVRLQISTHCPSLQNLNRILPMKIKYLQITRSDFTVNSTTFKIGIIRKYINRKNPKIVEEENTQGGYQYDTDSYGFRRNQRIAMPDVFAVEKSARELEEKQRLRNQCDVNEWRDVKELDREILGLEIRLEIYSAMLEVVDLPFTMYVQLMMIPEDGPPKVQYLGYNKTLQEVKDHFLLKLFGTNIPIHVKNMNVGKGYLLRPIYLGSLVYLDRDFTPSSEYYLKSPYFPLEASKLKVSNLSINWNISQTLNAIRPVLDGYPLKMINIDDKSLIPYNPIIDTSEFLNIAGNTQLYDLMTFLNKRVHLEECEFTVENVEELVEHWKSTEAASGKHFSIGFKEGKDVVTLLDKFRGLPGAKSAVLKDARSRSFPECVVLPIGGHSELNVYCERPKSQDADYCDTQWIVRIKIQDKGFADSLFLD